MTILFILATIFNMFAALAIKDLIHTTDLNWLKNKPVKIILLVPPIAIAILVIGWLFVIMVTILAGIREYLK